MEMDYNLKTFGGSFQVLWLYLAKIIEKLNTVCSRCDNSLDISPLVFQEHFVCERRHLIIILAKV